MRGAPLLDVRAPGLRRSRAAAALLVALLASGCRPAAPPRPRNLLLVSVDTLRADHLGCYGRTAARTPVIDGLAARGVLFEDAMAPAPLTAPSHATILTGLYPPEHGVRTNGLYRLDDEVDTVAEVLQRAGYHTAAAVSAFPLERRFGLSQGFAAYDDDLAPGGGLDGPQRRATEVADAALAQLAARPADKPLFMFVHFYDPHAEYQPPADLADLPPYDGEIAFVDRELGRLLRGLEQAGIREETAVVLVADHGESLDEHGETTHGVFVYQATLRVPMLLCHPGSLPQGRRLDATVSLVDVAPTLLDLLGAPSLVRTRGISLVALVQGGDAPTRALYFESLLPEVEFRWARLVGLRRGALKVIDAPRPEAYRLDRDPSERENVWAQEQGRERLAAELAALVGDMGARDARRSVSESERAQLEALGYLAGAGASGEAAPSERPDPKERAPVLRKMVAALTAFQSRRFEEAETLYRGALAEDPGNAVLMKNLGKTLGELGRAADAAEMLARGAAAAEGLLRADILETRAAYALRAGDAVGAVEDLEAARAIDPESTRGASLLADALTRLGRFDEARAVLDAARARHPGDPSLLVALAESEIRAGSLEAATGHLREALAIDPGHGAASYDLGSLLLDAGRIEEAVPHLERAHAAIPEDGDVLLKLSQGLVRAGRADRALALLRARLEAAPADEDAAYALGLTLSGSGAPREAVGILTALAGRFPERARVWNALGTAHGRAGDFAAAVRAFEEAASRAPDDPQVRANLEEARRARDAAPAP